MSRATGLGRAALVALLLVAVGCADGESVVDLTVSATDAVVGVDHLSVDALIVASGRQSTPQTVAVPASAGKLPDQRLPLVFPAFVRGTVRITVSAFGSGSLTPIASASVDVEVAPSKTIAQTLTLGGSAPTDGGGGTDLGVVVGDLGLRDLAGVPDASSGDMAIDPTRASVSSCSCTAPAGQGCVVGQLFDFLTLAPVTPGHQYRVTVYDPLDFFSGESGIVSVNTTTDCFAIGPITPPSLGVAIIGLTDDVSATQDYYPLAGAYPAKANIASQIDGYVIKRTTVADWSAFGGDGGTPINYTTQGGILLFYSNALRPMNDKLVANSGVPVSGVTPTMNSSAVPNVRFLNVARTGIDGTLGATGAIGFALLPTTVNVSTFSGTGGSCSGVACSWETVQGAGRTGWLLASPIFRQ